jgi:hypothetical protein
MTAAIKAAGEAADLRALVLSALERACRERVKLLSYMSMLKNDDIAVSYGPLTPRIANEAGLPIAQVRKVLAQAAAAGLVVRHQSRAGGMVNWWSSGLAEKLQQERAAREVGAK